MTEPDWLLSLGPERVSMSYLRTPGKAKSVAEMTSFHGWKVPRIVQVTVFWPDKKPGNRCAKSSKANKGISSEWLVTRVWPAMIFYILLYAVCIMYIWLHNIIYAWNIYEYVICFLVSTWNIRMMIPLDMFHIGWNHGLNPIVNHPIHHPIFWSFYIIPAIGVYHGISSNK